MSQPSPKSTVTAEWIHVSEPPPEVAGSPESRPKTNGGAPGLVLWDDPPQASLVGPERSSKVFVLEEVGLPEQPDPRLVLLREPQAASARSYRLLQHRLLAESDPRVIAVTSAEPGEGKTTCAANLALALAEQTMARVLLVEANLKRPALGKLFGYEPSESFVGRMVEYCDATPPYSVAAVLGTRLQVAALPSKVSPDAHLDRRLLACALHELRDVFDYVILDAASVLESADADVVSECADGVVVTLRSKKSKKSSLQRAVEQLAPARVFGTVLLDR